MLKPCRITNEMSKFCGWPIHELHSRLDITKKLCEYIKVHKLHDASDKRFIIPDANLRLLLNLNESHHHSLSFFHIQPYISNHIIKEDITPPLPVAPVIIN